MSIHIAQPGDEGAAAQELELPQALPVLPLRDSVAFPDTLTPLAIGQERSVQLVNDVLAGNRMLVMVASKDPEVENPGPDQIYRVGVAGFVARMLKVPDGSLRILVQGGRRVELTDFIATEPYMVARIESRPDVVEEGTETELEALARNVQGTFSQIISEVPYLPEELQLAVANLEDPTELAHLIAGALRLSTEEKQGLLEEVDVAKRLRRLSELLARELELISIGSRIQSQVQSEMEKGQREYFLRQQLKAIQDELGEVDEQTAEANELREQIEAAGLPDYALKAAERELDRLEKLPPQAAEHGVIRTYLEWLATLPWSKSTDDDLDLKKARRVLDRDHYDIDKVKERILEFLAVRKLKPDAPSSVLCFVGPPGVGKTSLGRSIAAAMGRKFERISVGGVRDESEIRGHRRTYIGAMPGTIIRSLRDAESNNPVLMIDEIDKMGADFRGDPASAMLEVLDPAQNSSFRDHYLDLPFDLSRVLFITTANQLEPVPPPLRDRMEIIELAGYTEDEKVQIAKRYLVPRQLEQTGLSKEKLAFEDGGAARDHRGLHARGGRARARAPDRSGLPEGRARPRRGAHPQADDPQAPGARDARAAPLPVRRRPPHRPSGRGDRTGVDSRRRRRALRGGDGLPGQGRAPDHRTARRRHEGVGFRGDVMGEGPARRSRAVRRARRPRPRPRRRDPEGRAERGHHDGDGALLALHGAPGALGHRDDG